MAMTTDTDIREIKDLINGLREEMRSGFTDANNHTNALREEMRSGFADANNRTSDLREEVRLGFSDLRGQINTVEAKLEGKIDTLDERTKLGFWGFILRGTFLAISTTMLATLTTIFVSYVLPILLQNLPKP
jgi:hypothetical protein